MDMIGDFITMLRPSHPVFKGIVGRGKWEKPAVNIGISAFSSVLHGQCEVEIEHGRRLSMNKGDFVFYPRLPSLTLTNGRSSHESGYMQLFEIWNQRQEEKEAEFRMVAGSFHLAPYKSELLAELLPRQVYIPAGEADTKRIHIIIQLLEEECEGLMTCQTEMKKLLTEALLIEVVRWAEKFDQLSSSSLLKGLQNSSIAAALRGMHSDVKRKWTVRELAREAGMSRSSFAMHFRNAFGCAPMEYLFRLRMSLACEALSNPGTSLESVALSIGYRSASAFSTAFKNRFGAAPRIFARTSATRGYKL